MYGPNGGLHICPSPLHPASPCELIAAHNRARSRADVAQRNRERPPSNTKPKKKQPNTYRPRCVERKSYRIDEAQRLCTLRRQVHAVVAQHRRPDVAKCALGAHLDARLIVRHADAKSRPTRADARAAVVGDAAAAFADIVFAVLVAEVLEAQLEQAGTADLIGEWEKEYARVYYIIVRFTCIFTTPFAVKQTLPANITHDLIIEPHNRIIAKCSESKS